MTEEFRMFRLAFNMTGFKVSDAGVEMIVRIVDTIREKGDLSLKELAAMELEVRSKYPPIKDEEE